MKKNLVPLLGIAFVVAIAATGIFYGLFVSQLRVSSADAEKQTIVVAARAVDRGQALKADDLKLSRWAGAPPPGAYQKVDDALGKVVYNNVLENEPVTQSRLATEGNKSATGGGITRGMRAISVRASDSSGLLAFLRAGQRVDVQVFTVHSGEPVVRTLLQNIEVLSVSGLDANGQAPVPVVNLLVTPKDADRLALADSAARVRLLLRNPLDNEEPSRSAVDLANVMFDRSSPRALIADAQPKPAAPEHAAAEVTLEVRIAGAAQSSLREIENRLTARMSDAGALQVSAWQRGVDADSVLRQLAQRQQMEFLSNQTLHAQNFREVTMKAGKEWTSPSGSTCGLRIQFTPQIGPNGALRLRVKPEITTPLSSGPAGVHSRRLIADVDLADGQSLLLTGFGSAAGAPDLLRLLFNGYKPSGVNNELLVVVTPRVKATVVRAAVNLP